MRWAISISLGILFLLGVLLILSPVEVSSLPEIGAGLYAEADFPLLPVGEQVIAPGVGASPGGPLVDPRTGEVLICRRGGTTVVSGVEVASVIPDYCVLDVDPQTGRRFAINGNELAVLVGDRAVLNVTFPYTVASVRYNPKNGLLYAVHCSSGYFPECTLAVVQGSKVAYTMSLGAYGGRPEVHPDSGLTYVPAGTAVKVLSGTQVVASLPVSGPIHSAVYHPFNRRVYAWGGYGGGEIVVIQGTSIQSRIPITDPVMLAPDPNRDHAYVTDLYGRMTVISRTGVISVLQISSPYVRNPVDVLPGSGEIVVGVVPSREVRIFSPQLGNPTVISMQVPPFTVRAHPSGRVYIVERDGSYPPEPQTGLLVLSRTVPLAHLPAGYGLGPVAVRPDTGVAYALDTLNGTLYLLSGTQVLTSVSLRPWMASSLVPHPESMALDPGTGMAYAGHRSANLLWVVHGTEVQTLSLSNFGSYAVSALAADPVHGVVYVGLDGSPRMLLISGTEVLTSVEWAGSPQGLSAFAVDPERGWLYGLGRVYSVAVFSVTTPVTQTFWVTSAGCGMATFALAVQPANGLAYAGCGEYPGFQGFVQILNGPDVVARVPVSGYAKSLAADPTTGWVYGALSGAYSAAVFSGTEMYTVPLPFDPGRAWFNPVDGMGYIAGGSRVAVLEGPRLRYVLRVGISPDSMAFDPVRERAYLTHYGDNRVIVFGKLPYRTYLPLVLRVQ